MAVLRWATGTHEGQVREANEDAAFASPQLFVVADGMGGHLAGEVASSLAIQTLETDLVTGEEITLDQLVDSIASANRSIFTDANDNPDHSGMGTTVTAIAVVTDRYDGEALGIANVGDSRIYLFRHQRLRQVTIDHSFVQELIAEGAITRDEARHHPRRNIVTRGLGIESAVRVDSWTLPLIRDDRFLLCSDGLSDYVTEDEIAEILKRHPDDPEPAVLELIDAANEAGGHDNITVVLVDVLDGDEPPDPTEEFDVVPDWYDDDDDDTQESFIVADPLPDDDPMIGPITVIASADELDGDAEAAVADNAAASDEPAGGDPVDDQSTGEIGQADDADTDQVETQVVGAQTADGSATETKQLDQRRQRSGLTRFVLFVGVAAVVIGAASLFAAWARRGYYVAFDDSGVVSIYKGRKGGVLWFEPTLEGEGQLNRSELDAKSVAAVEEEPEFSSLENAVDFINNQLSAKKTATDTGTESPDADTAGSNTSSGPAPPSTTPTDATEP